MHIITFNVINQFIMQKLNPGLVLAIINNSGADWLNDCAFSDKSIKFVVQLEKCIYNDSRSGGT